MTVDVHRYSFARSDLKVTLDGIALKPGFALGSYAAFVATGKDVAVMGDLVLTEAEVSPVMAKLQVQDLEVSAVHNHLLREEPRVMYMHYVGRSPEQVDEFIHDVIDPILSRLPEAPPAEVRV